MKKKKECSLGKKLSLLWVGKKMKTMQHDALDWIDPSKVSETQKSLVWLIHNIGCGVSSSVIKNK